MVKNFTKSLSPVKTIVAWLNLVLKPFVFTTCFVTEAAMRVAEEDWGVKCYSPKTDLATFCLLSVKKGEGTMASSLLLNARCDIFLHTWTKTHHAHRTCSVTTNSVNCFSEPFAHQSCTTRFPGIKKLQSSAGECFSEQFRYEVTHREVISLPALEVWETYPKTIRGMRHSVADSMKAKVGYHATVAEYTVLKTAIDVLVVRLSTNDRKAKSDPVGKEQNTRAPTPERRLACWLANRTTGLVLKGFHFAPSKQNFKSTCLLSTLGPKRQTTLQWTWWTVQTRKATNCGATHPAQPWGWSLTSWSATLGRAWSPGALAASLSSRGQTLFWLTRSTSWTITRIYAIIRMMRKVHCATTIGLTVCLSKINSEVFFIILQCQKTQLAQ